MADKKLNEVTTVSDFDYFLGVKSNGDVLKMNKRDMAKVVEGLIGIATTQKNGLMPTNRVIGVQYNSENKITKFVINDNDGFGFILSVLKNHENTGNSVVLITGYNKGIVANSIRKGSYLSKLAYKINGGKLEIYVQTSAYTFSNAMCIATSSGNIRMDSTLVDSIPSDAVNVSF